MNAPYDYSKFRVALLERQTEIMLDIKRTEKRLAELRKEAAETQTAIDNVAREQMKANDIY